MATFIINKDYSGSRREVEAQSYEQEGDYFVFYTNGKTEKALSIRASEVVTVNKD